MSLEQDTAAFLERLEETTEEVEGIIAQLDLIDDAFAGCTFYTDISSTHHFRLNVWLGFENEKSFKCLDLSKLRTLILQSPLKLHIEILASEYGWSWNDIEFVLEKYIIDDEI